jgi:CheY-like chemotaxis protein
MGIYMGGMGGMGGIEGIARIAAMRQKLPIIAISGGHQDTTTEKTLRAATKVGASAVLAKPFTADDLTRLVWEALDW